ncbi:hypothetical protein H1Q78_11840 [Cellulosimicrobium cellulans]|uniref:hypothetical protein n=1 Tax=Cellulosimicrobium cellulans TaxID=1710 RepID=UPI001EDBF3E5|nr:hypothetical protein [Cellulosimicrobium cellulans]UKJ62474.1 hypothetical protein H1Q78_11840 [Cellulosimicrobium cellulans]
MTGVATGPAPGPREVAPTAFSSRALAARERYDAALARALALGADRDVLADAVREAAVAADPLARRLGVDAFAATCDALVDAVARLVAARRWRVGGPERHAVLDLVPRLGPWLAAAPAVTVAAVVDGARAVGGGPGSRGDVAGWATRVVAAAEASPAAGPSTPVAGTVRGAVLVAAWRSGLVRYRDAALDAARSLPAQVARAALSLPATGADAPTGPADLRAVLDRHAADPWWWPAAPQSDERGGTRWVRLPGAPVPAQVLGRFGGFRGFGGPWRSPALVVGADARHPGLRWVLLSTGDGPPPAAGTAADGTHAVAVGDETVEWTLVADVHGAFVARAPGSGDHATGTVTAPAPDAADQGLHGSDHGPAGRRAAAPAPDDVLSDVSGAAVVETPSGRLALLSRTGSYDVLLVRWPR